MLTGGWRDLERVTNMDEFEFPAERGDLHRFPRAARFPAEEEFATLGFFEKSFQTGNVFSGRGETGRALEENEKRTEFLRHGKRLIPCPADGGVETKMAAVLPVMIVETGALVGGAGRAMGDDLPGFQGKLEVCRRIGAPAGSGLKFWQLIKTGVNLNAGELPEIFSLRERKAATAGQNRWRFCAHARLLGQAF